MADTVHQGTVNILDAEGANLVHAQNIVHMPVNNVTNGEDLSEDILQQAFQEASGPFVQEAVTYAPGQVPVGSLEDGTNVITLSEGTVISGVGGDGEIMYTLGSEDMDVNGVVQQEVQEMQGLAEHQVNGNVSEAFLQQVVDQVGNGIGEHHLVDENGQRIIVQLQEHDGSSEHEHLHNTVQTVLQPSEVNQLYETPVTNGTVDPEQTVQDAVEDPPSEGTSSDVKPEPLGSCQNPIRIIQQGNQYTSLQQLTSDQLSQIMQVVQQQQLVKKTTTAAIQGSKDDESSIIYNPQTQTRIVYKVLYPSELHKTSQNSKSTNSSSPTSENATAESGTNSKPRTQICVPTDSVYIALPRRPYKKRNKDDDEKLDGPEFTREEKDDRKKHRPRTRSGRVSRPPKHMVKDYKHIHPVDWDEDQDNSDGGYSDFQPSSGEGDEADSPGGVKRKKDANYMPYSLIGHGKAKPWQCKVCDKAYIGKAGLARHYRLQPDHGKDDENLKDLVFNGLESGNSMDSMAGSNTDGDSLNHSLHSHDDPMDEANLSREDVKPNELSPAPVTNTTTATTTATPTTKSASPPTTVSATATLPTTTKPAASTLPKPPPYSKVAGKSSVAARGAATTNGVTNSTSKPPLKGVLKNKANNPKSHIDTLAKKKVKLKEFLTDLSDEELMELVLPRLSSVVTTWEFLLMRVERGRPVRPQLVDLLQEYAQLYRRIRRMTEEQLHPVTRGKPITAGTTQIQISDELVAKSLDLSTGMYTVEPNRRREDAFKYKLLTANPKKVYNTNTLSKRTLETVSTDKDLVPSAKRPCLEQTESSSGSQAPTTDTPAPAVSDEPELAPGQTLLKPGIAAALLSKSPPKTLINNNMSRTVVVPGTLPKIILHHEQHAGSDSIDEPPEDQEATPQESSTMNDLETEHNFVDDHDVQQNNLAEAQESPTVDDTPNTTTMTQAPDFYSDGVGNESEVSQSLVTLDTQVPEQESTVEETLNLLGSNPNQQLTHVKDETLTLVKSEGAVMNGTNDSMEMSLHPTTSSEIVHDIQPTAQENDPGDLELKPQLASLEQHMTTGPKLEDLQLPEPPASQAMPLVGPLTPAGVESLESSIPGTLAEEEQVQGQGMLLGASTSETVTYNSVLDSAGHAQYVTDEGFILQETHDPAVSDTAADSMQILVQDQDTFLGQPVIADPGGEVSADNVPGDNQLILIKNPDGTIQIHRQGNQPISLETLQALLGMELDINSMAATESTDSV